MCLGSFRVGLLLLGAVPGFALAALAVGGWMLVQSSDLPSYFSSSPLSVEFKLDAANRQGDQIQPELCW